MLDLVSENALISALVAAVLIALATGAWKWWRDRRGYGTLYKGQMREVTKEKFKKIYFKLGGGAQSGWTREYWNEFFEDEKKPGMKYLVQEPETRKHTRMMIVTDYENNEYRLFFLTEESEESFFDFPDER
jgi:hypothetical protein